MQKPKIRPLPFEQSRHFELREKAFEFFLARTADEDEAVKLANMAFNVRILKSAYPSALQAQIDGFLKTLDEI